MIYSEPRIVVQKNGRWKVYFSVTSESGEKTFYRLSSGTEFGLEGLGNTHQGIVYKRKYFSELRNLISEKLAAGWYPGKEKQPKYYSLKKAFQQLQKHIDSLALSKRYKHHLILMMHSLLKHLKSSKPAREQLTEINLRNFLHNYASGTYFNNQKAHLSALLSMMVDIGLLESNPVKEIKTIKAVAEKNVSFTDEQLKLLFDALKDYHRNLYLACLLMYTTLLRPHQEIRHLKRAYFNRDLTLLTVPQGYTKNRNGRNIPLSENLTQVLMAYQIHQMLPDDYIFGKLYNAYYFSLVWKRFLKVYPFLVNPGQTLYSFRHSAAIKIYKKTGSAFKVKIAMDHSDIATTYAYLRSLDIYENKIDVGDLPDVPL